MSTWRQCNTADYERSQLSMPYVETRTRGRSDISTSLIWSVEHDAVRVHPVVHGPHMTWCNGADDAQCGSKANTRGQGGALDAALWLYVALT